MLRSCYSADMQFFNDSAETRRVVWYRVPDDRECLPFATVFASRIYERDSEPQLAIGELYTPVPWRGGQAPGPVASGGKCGDANTWLNGVSINDPPPATWPGTNVPKCCNQPAPQFLGQAAHGGIWALPYMGEAAGGGMFLEPLYGEAAHGGVIAVSSGYAGEEAQGGFILEPFQGESAGGGEETHAFAFFGGAAHGGEISYSMDQLEAGGSAGGGTFHVNGPSPAVATACDADPIPKTLAVSFSGASGTCGCTNGVSFALTWSSGSTWTWAASFCGLSWTGQLSCAAAVWHFGGAAPVIGGGSFSGTLTGSGGVGTTLLSGTMTAGGVWCAGTFVVTVTG